jgi:RNA polymerase sigma factor (sigma-70 family)
MATRQINRVVEQVRKAILASDSAGVSDGQLLECFIARREEAAFALLLCRHGPMVLSVCERVLGNYHDAEDAFQATFLVLARRAGSIVPRHTVGNWLYGVAYHTALKARSMSAKREAREKQMNIMPEREAPVHDSWPELQRELDKELSRLSDKYRVPIVLCDLEGNSQKDAARHLGLPEGTFSSRLSRGRAMLAKRLARHGLTFSAGTLAVALIQNGAAASVPSVLASSTIKAADAFAAGQSAAGLVSGSVASLTDGVLKAMLLHKLKLMAAVLAVLGMFTLGGGLLTHHIAAGQQNTREPEAPAKDQAAQTKDNGKKAETPAHPAKKGEPKEVQTLVDELYDAASKEWRARLDEFEARRHILPDKLHAASARLMRAELEKVRKPDDRVAAHKGHWQRMKSFEDTAKPWYDAGTMEAAVYYAVRFWRLEAELGLERAKNQAAKQKSAQE